MAETSQMARSYLKNLGYKDEDITYQKGTNGGQGTINLGGKFFANGTPGADGYINLGTSALDSAMNNYKGNQLTSKTNDLIGQYEKNIMQPIQPFTYDVNQIKNDPAYKSQLNSFTQDTNRGTNQALVNLGRRGIGNSQSGVVAETAGQQNINNFANNELLPRQIAEAYSKYVDQNAAIRQQNQDILGLAGTYNDQGQQLFDNSRTNRLDDRTIMESDREYDYRTDRNNILDERYKTEYDEDVRRYGIDYAHKKAIENGQLGISQQNANTSAASTANSAANSKIDNLMASFKATGIAPAGLESIGINEGDKLPIESSSTTPKAGDYKTDPVFIRSLQGAGTGELTSAEILADASNIIKDITYDGYTKLLSAAKVFEASQNNRY